MIWVLIGLAVCVSEIDRKDADTLVVCPSEFREALQPWVEHRRLQGYKIAFLQPVTTGPGIRAQIKQFAELSPLKNVVIVGDAVDVNVRPSRLVATDYVNAKVNVKFGSEPEIATDNTFADLNNDGIVDVNIGRIPVDNVAELTAYIARVIEYESDSSQGDWQRRINFVAGVGGFGQMLDKMIEQSVKKIVTDLIPAEYDMTMTYGSWRSPYCPDPRRFSSAAISRFNEGCLFWVYVGHGNRQRLDSIRLPDREYGILSNGNVSQIQADSGAPIAIFLSCYTAAMDAANDGLAETMLKQNRGPIAIISSSRVSMPYAMSIFSLEMLDGFFYGDASTLGELVKQSKRKLVSFDARKSAYHGLVESMGKAFSPDPKLLVEERVEHVHLMHLIGDPLLRLKRPNRLKLDSPKSAAAGEALVVSGTAERAGDLLLDLTYRRDRFRHRPPRRKTYLPSSAAFEQYQYVYRQTQKRVCASIEEQVSAGPFSFEILVPADCSGDCHVRGILIGDQYVALNANDIEIAK